LVKFESKGVSIGALVWVLRGDTWRWKFVRHFLRVLVPKLVSLGSLGPICLSDFTCVFEASN
jgi:hypothetical protein